MTKLTDESEYLTEQEKITFQSYLTALLEAHSDFLYKISQAKGGKKTGIWIELSEAEIISSHILECSSNIMASYQRIVDAHRLLNINYRAAKGIIKNDLRQSLEDFKSERITKEQFSARLNQFIAIQKNNLAA